MMYSYVKSYPILTCICVVYCISLWIFSLGTLHPSLVAERSLLCSSQGIAVRGREMYRSKLPPGRWRPRDTNWYRNRMSRPSCFNLRLLWSSIQVPQLPIGSTKDPFGTTPRGSFPLGPILAASLSYSPLAETTSQYTFCMKRHTSESLTMETKPKYLVPGWV